MYNYRKDTWRKYYKQGKEIIYEQSDRSEILQVNFGDLILL
ncbi:MAG: hypothetical protein NZ516_07165 [Raineya sp.]|nr:hypothetical protein [Raineya sp.]